MRMFILLIAVISASALSFIASADNSRGFSFEKSETVEEAAVSRCVKKIAVGADTACLMQKRKGRA